MKQVDPHSVVPARLAWYSPTSILARLVCEKLLQKVDRAVDIQVLQTIAMVWTPLHSEIDQDEGD